MCWKETKSHCDCGLEKEQFLKMWLESMAVMMSNGVLPWTALG